MPRIYQSTFQPFTYEELATPLREATVAHQKVEEDYNNNMLVVDSLRQRAASELETNPESKWAVGVLNYADQLEQYAGDLARNGLTRQTRNDLLNMKRGYGTTVSPVLMAILREKELQSVRDKAVGTNMVFGRMPSLDEIISNQNISQVGYNGDDLYKRAHDAAKAASERNLEIIKPRNLDAWRYEYGKKKGFTNDEINYLLSNEPAFAEMFGSIVNASGFAGDKSLDDNQRNQLYNQIISGALSGFTYDEDWHYANRTDNPYAALDHEIKNRQLNPQNYPGYGMSPQEPNDPSINIGVIPLASKQTATATEDFRNSIINDKNIVTSVKHDVNGDTYEISDDYINNIFKGLNYEFPVTGIKSADKTLPYLMEQNDTGSKIAQWFIKGDKSNENIKWQDVALRFGITKEDTHESATRKIQNVLSKNIDYNDLADTSLHNGLRVWLDSTLKEDIKLKYGNAPTIAGNTDMLVMNDDGSYTRAGKNKKITTKDYTPSYVFVDSYGPKVVWKNNETDDFAVTPYYDQTYSDIIKDHYTGADNMGGPMYQLERYNSLVNDFANNIKRNGIDHLDNEKLKRYKITLNGRFVQKGDLINLINKTGNYTGDNRKLVYDIALVERDYYQKEANELYWLMQDPEYQNDIDIINQYRAAVGRLAGVEDLINILESSAKQINKSLAGVKTMIMNDLPQNSLYTGEKFKGLEFQGF